MKAKAAFLLLFSLTVFFSCKKEEGYVDHHPSHIVGHFAYVRGVVVDSVTGMPVPNAIVYFSEDPFPRVRPDSTAIMADVNGKYTRRIDWYEGSVYGGPYVNTIAAGNAYMCAYTNTLCKSFKFNVVLLRENDTITLPDIRLKPYGYIKAHIKDIPSITGSGSGIYLDWYYTMEPSPVLYEQNLDTSVFRKACPDVKIQYDWTISSSLYFYDSVVVRSGDTAYVDVFY